MQARIDAVTALIVAYEAAVLALSSGISSYTIDSGQTRQQVTRANMTELRRTLVELYSQLDAWDRMLNGGTGTYAAPMW